jgi:hypothetical protein
MNRRELLRNSLLTIGAAASVNIPAEALVFASGDDASRELARSDWKPVFLDPHQNKTLIALSEAIIPATNTPGGLLAPRTSRFDQRLQSREWRFTSLVRRGWVTIRKLRLRTRTASCTM